MKKMRIRIDRTGRVSISVEGAAGPDCLTFTKAVEQAVGAVEKRTLTEAYHEDELVVGVRESALESENL